MSLINPLVSNSGSNDGPIKNGSSSTQKMVKFDFSSFVKEGAKDTTNLNSSNNASGETSTAPKKRGRPKKESGSPDTTPAPITSGMNSGKLSMLQSNEPYISTYNETLALTRGSIAETDQLNEVVKGQLTAVIDSKTLRKKYDYVSELSSTSANLISTKLRAISEMNKIISDAHKLDLQRMKDLKLSQAADDADSDKRIADMYNAFINTPIGTYGAGPQFPSMQELTMPGGNVAGVDITVPMPSVDPGYDAWRQNISPEVNRMILEKKNPNVETVVVYDQTTNNKYFDVIDRATGQSVPNVPRPDPFLLADTYPNINNMTARNSNIDAVYPLVLTGAPSSINDF